MRAEENTNRSISAIMPVRDGEAFLAETLPPLARLLREGMLCELIVVDDGSVDRSASLALEHGARVLTTDVGGQGPAVARNLAARLAEGDILWFVDADVIAPLDAVTLLRAAFADPQVVAAFGSYDEYPRARNFLSQYKNLAHRFYHQRGRREATTFWAGCGAVRADAFRAADGFDTRRFDRPAIEDIELGYRLRDANGRIRLLPGLQATHLKAWRLGNLVSTDVFCRAIPWTRLLVERGSVGDDLNVARGERVRAAIAVVDVLVLLGALAGVLPWWLLPALIIITIGANTDLFRFFHARRGLLFASAALLFHQFYYLYSTAAFVGVVLHHQARRLLPAKALK